MSKFSWVYTTWPDEATARTHAEILVAEHLCACANIISGMTSVYRWKGKVETASETVMILKTTAKQTAKLKDRISELHPYETACIIALDINADASSQSYLNWLDNQSG